MQGTTTAPMKQAIPRYKSPEITLQELRVLAWLRSLSHKEYETLVKEANKTKPPIGPQGPEVFMEEWGKALLAEGKARRTVEIYLSGMGTLQRFLVQQEIDITEMGTDLVRKYATHITSKGYGLKSLDRKLTVLRRFLKYLFCQKVLDISNTPAPRVFKVRSPQNLPDHLNQEDVEKLLMAPDNITPYGIRDRAILAYRWRHRTEEIQMGMRLPPSHAH